MQQYYQLPLEEKPVSLRAWVDMGAVEQECPGCGQFLMYPGHLNSYAVVCPCGWFTMPHEEEGFIVWFPPVLAQQEVAKRERVARGFLN